jgi:integrase
MKQVSSFDISEFTNPSGEVVFRVSGWLDGQRVRKNFPTRAEAEVERQTLEIKRVQLETPTVRPAITRLTDEQLHEAESVLRRLKGESHTLTFCVDFTLKNYRAPETQKQLADAVAEYVAAKQREMEQGHICRAQLDRIVWDLDRLVKHFAGRSVAELTVANLIAFLETGQTSLKTYNNRRGILSTFFKFAFHRAWIVDNPILRVPHHRIRRKRGVAQTFTAAQARELMEHFETFERGRWVPYFALCLFAGIRPGVPDGEIHKLKPDAVNLETGIITITPDVSKVREPRKITIQPNLAAWLRAYPLKKFPIVVGDFQKRRRKFRDKFNLTHDVLRHTFISMFVAKFRSFGEAALQAGNSESIIRKHYLDLKTSEEAENFFAIMPKKAATACKPRLAAPETQAAA